MANSNSKKINMNKKEIEKTLGKKTNTNAKKNNSNKNNPNKNKNNQNQNNQNQKQNQNKKPVNNNQAVNKPIPNKPEVNNQVADKPVTNKPEVNDQVANKKQVKKDNINNNNNNKPKEIPELNEPIKVISEQPKEEKETEKKSVKSILVKKEAIKNLINKRENNQKPGVKTNKNKKKVNKKDVFKVNKDGSLYDLSSIYPKKKVDKKKKETSVETPTGFKETFFEELNEREVQEKKQESKQNLKKFLIIVAIVAGVLLVGTFGYKRYKRYVKEHLRVYDEYKLGSEVKTADGSIWYVVEYSDNSNSVVKLLNSGLIDINSDGSINENDKMRFSTDSDKYDKTDATGIGYFLLNNYKNVLEKKLGFPIDDIDLLTSKEFVRVRDYLGYGYEWNEGNFLASNEMNYYWINSESDKMYVVSPRGTYKMTSKDNLYYVRCVITVSKDNLKIFVDKEE